MRALNIGATGMLAQQTNVEVISNNIANMNTTAYTRRRAEFHDLLYQNLRRAGSNSSDTGTIVPTGVQLGLGVKTAAVYRITEQGSVTSTDNALDLAIQGKGYFQIDLPSGETAYTRDGAFQLSPNGEIVTHDGYRVTGLGAIPTNAESITINPTGEVLYKIDGQTALVNAGQIQTAIFPNDAGLNAIGDNYLTETAGSGAPTTGVPGSVGFGTILQGYLESSNVNVVSEITELISAQRAYEMNSKVITTSDEMLSTVSRMK
ncbi:flagellar basal-body rod protein FlgG [Rhodospirillum rubrum]|uniref:flagellar basal-body rod protein FlgG n=1 Tax=Rhodospirillum rubrum TaxID=1085 RepID=UPI001903BF37|nr:flagellar basal-body rod protein FlgG [Rhodospirillum rubrum]MBK1666233.1 flagellar basal-body rod protein FlgG [Rhodospirillum rubrum]MBK1677318.1 flagellar basal-body rod protein FlgG [Rhodospirillum rubrum]